MGEAGRAPTAAREAAGEAGTTLGDVRAGVGPAERASQRGATGTRAAGSLGLSAQGNSRPGQLTVRVARLARQSEAARRAAMTRRYQRAPSWANYAARSNCPRRPEMQLGAQRVGPQRQKQSGGQSSP